MIAKELAEDMASESWVTNKDTTHINKK